MDDQKITNRPLRVFLWIIPRTNSTALTKCMSFVDETEVWMEPYLACHINDTVYNPEWGKGIPAIERPRTQVTEITSGEEYKAIKQLEMEEAKKYKNVTPQEKFRYPWLKEQLELDPMDKKLVFIKDESFTITNHLEYLPYVPTRHTFLIRHPQEVYPSVKNVCVKNAEVLNVTWDEFHLGNDVPHIPIKDFFQIHCNFWKYVKENLDPDPIIIDGFDLTTRPDEILPKYFEKLGIPYRDSYLQWKSDPELVYSSWRGSSEFVISISKTIATNRAVESTRFEPPKNPRGTPNPAWKITNEVKEFIDEAMPYYDEMYENRLT
ncbi:hypothetical protein HOLleu_14090 [Holothuria leucospilota]|uniref:Sulfotransferase family protein n=1 Tax=Holothuria leucospilota TaxID=206669 RepID=A0A9Q1HBH8_HOLLE|nr:hypothetical protein HOLleu_14090 [Holothuria leucospilota]